MVACIGVWLAPTAVAAPGELSVVAPEKVSVTVGDGDPTTITVLNAGAAVESPTFRVVSDKEVTVEPPAVPRLPANAVTRVELKFKPADSGTTKASGQLVVSAADRAPAAVPFALASKATAPGWTTVLILGALGVAVALVLAGWLTMSRRPGIKARLGPVEWDFSKSWAGNITVFSALLGTILSAGVLPEDTPPERVATYAGLNLLFGIGVLVGPFLYSAFESPVKVNRRSKVKEPQYQGRVWAFLLATLVTIWATIGELATMANLFDEVRSGGSLPLVGLVAFEVLIGVAALAMGVLIWTRMRAILSSQTEPIKSQHRATQHRRLTALGITDLPPVDPLEPAPEDEAAQSFEPELEPWSAY